MISESDIHMLNGISCVRKKKHLIGVEEAINKKLFVN